MTGVAIIAGSGALPGAIKAAMQARGEAALLAALDGFLPEGLVPDLVFRLERLVPSLRHLAGQGVERVVLAGAVTRPRLDPAAFDPDTAQMLPDLLAAMQAGDDGTLRALVAMIEDQGLAVVGVADLAPDLIPGAGLLCGHVTVADRRDASRAADIVAALGAVDVGQGAVVAQGLCLAVEALPGTDAMLTFVAGHGLRPDPAGPKGVLFKAPKPGQDLRFDLPTIGPATVRHAAAAGLGGIAWQAGGVIVIDRAATVAAAVAAGLFLWARDA